MCVISIAEHRGQPAIVVRQAYELLRDMKDTNNTQVNSQVDTRSITTSESDDHAFGRPCHIVLLKSSNFHQRLLPVHQ